MSYRRDYVYGIIKKKIEFTGGEGGVNASWSPLGFERDTWHTSIRFILAKTIN